MFVLTPSISHKTGTKRSRAKTPKEEKKPEGNCHFKIS